MKPGLTHWADLVVIVVYFCFVLAVGIWAMCRPTRGSVKGYFLAGRDMIWWPVGPSLFASNIGSEHFIGLAGSGAASGIAIVLYEFSSMPLVLLLGWIFLPVYVSAGVYTLPEYLQKRFGGRRLRLYLSGLALVLYIVTKIAVCIYAGALFIQLSLGWDMYLSIVILLLVTGVYTVLGGLTAVIYTDALQTIIMMLGALVLCIISFIRVGGYEMLRHTYMRAIPDLHGNWSACGRPRADAFNLFRHPLNADQPWPGLVLQSTIGCLWYWCADQVIVQRALAAKTVSHAKGGAILAGYLKLLPLFFMVMPGMISRALFPDEVACVDAERCRAICNNPVGCSNIAYPKLVMQLLPTGLRGLLLAVMMSAIMSSLTSIFNSASTLFTMDLWRRFRPGAQQMELLVVGRVCIVVLCVVSILWVPLVESSAGGQLFNYIQAIQGYLGTPIGALFLLAVFWKRMNEHGAFWGILAGHACGVTRMVLDFVYPAPQCGLPDTRPPVVSRVHYTYFSQMNLVITAVVMVTVSLLTRAQEKAQLKGVTWWTRLTNSSSNDDAMEEKSRDTDYGVRDKKADTANGQIVVETDTAVDAEDSHQMSRAQRLFHFVCGTAPHSSVGVESIIDRKKILKESPFWRKVLNVNAIIGMAVMCWLCGFFH